MPVCIKTAAKILKMTILFVNTRANDGKKSTSARNFEFDSVACVIFVDVSRILFAACLTTVLNNLLGNITAKNPIMNKIGAKIIHPKNQPNGVHPTINDTNDPNCVPQNRAANAAAIRPGDSCS